MLYAGRLQSGRFQLGEGDELSVIAAAVLGSFAAVAKQLNAAPSVVTRQVAALEAHLGCKLMERSTRRLRLTSSGADYLEQCRVILNLVEVAEYPDAR